MKKIILYLSAFLIGSVVSYAQEDAFYLQINSDTILAGNVLQISFVANNVAGKFEGPDLKELNVISGPNTSTSMSMVNGDISQYASYSYGLYLEDIGEIIIPPAYLLTSDGTLETEPKSIIVLPNPEGIIEEAPPQSGMYQFSFPNIPNRKREEQEEYKPKKKKRKLKKI